MEAIGLALRQLTDANRKTPDEMLATSGPIIFWSCDRDADRLTCDTIADAVGEWVDDGAEPMPDEVTVYGWARMVPDAKYLEWLASRVLDDLYDAVDEEFGDPDGEHGDRKTPAMREAAERFVAAFLGQYQVWACELVETRTVAVADYVEAGA